MKYEVILKELENLSITPLNKKSINHFENSFQKFIKSKEFSKKNIIQVIIKLNTVLKDQLNKNVITPGKVTEVIYQINKINNLINQYFF